MHSAWVSLMDTYANTADVLIASADCQTTSRYPGTGSALCDHYRVPHYPYLVYGDAANPVEYTGSHDYNSLLTWAETYLGPVIPAPTPPAPTPPTPTPPTPTPPAPTPPSPSPSNQCPDDAVLDSNECIWTNNTQGLVMPPSPSEYCDYLEQGVFGYYWIAGNMDYGCAVSARKTQSNGQTFCLWEDGNLGVKIPPGSMADCGSLVQGRIGLLLPTSETPMVV